MFEGVTGWSLILRPAIYIQDGHFFLLDEKSTPFVVTLFNNAGTLPILLNRTKAVGLVDGTCVTAVSGFIFGVVEWGDDYQGIQSAKNNRSLYPHFEFDGQNVSGISSLSLCDPAHE